MEKYYLKNEARQLLGELWKPIPFNSNYLVSNYGRVMSTCKYKQGIILKQKQKTYLCVSFRYNGKVKSFLTHRLVALVFIENSLNRPIVNHIDGNKFNNHVSNLEWCTARENSIHSINILGNVPPIGIRIFVNQYGANNQRARPVLQIRDGKIIAEYGCINDATLDTGITHSGISRCCSGKQKTSKGFEWKYKEKRE